MRGLLSVFLLTASLFSSGLETARPPAFYGDTRPPRQIAIGKDTFADFPASGAGNLEVVLEKGASQVTAFAAHELKDYLEKRLKTTVPLVQTPTDGKFSFIVGINSFSRKAGIDDSKLCRDAFILKTSGNKIYLLGRDDPKTDMKAVFGRYGGVWAQLYERGSIFAVYDFLERFASIRFFFHDSHFIVVPKNKPMRIPVMDIYDRPDFEDRYYSAYTGSFGDETGGSRNNGFFSSFMKVSEAKSRTTYYNRLQTRYVPNCHGVGLLKYKDRFGKLHPEYFAMREDGSRYLDGGPFAGQLCLSSMVREEIYKDALAILKNQPPESRGLTRWPPDGQRPGEIFGHHFQDGFFQCRCPECQKYFSKGDIGASNLVWSCVANTAFRLQKEKIPGLVTMMAYTPYHEVPDIALPENLAVMVAASGPWAPHDRTELIKRWSQKLQCKVWLWNSMNKIMRLSLPGINCSTPRAIGKYYKNLAPYIWGAFIESHVDRTVFHYLNYYVFGKVAWDNSTDVDALLKDHYQAMYGPAADDMEKIFDRFEFFWMNRIGGRFTNTNLGPVATPATENEIWNDIYSPAELASLSAQFDAARKRAAGNPEILGRIDYVRGEFLDPLLRLSKDYFARNSAVKNFYTVLVPSEKKLAVTVDGIPDEPVWKQATELVLQPYAPEKGIIPSKSVVKLAMDPEYLYVACIFEEPEMEKVTAMKRPDKDRNLWEDNNFEFMLNPSGDRKNYYHFIVNSLGSKSDAASKMFGTNFKLDHSWNSGAEVKVSRNKTSWCAEYAIPLKNMGVFDKQGFVANFGRNQAKPRKSFLYSWSPFLKNGFHDLENFGTILFRNPDSRSILANGSFEAPAKPHNFFGVWRSNWNMPDGCAASQDNTTFISGGQSLKMSSSKGISFQTGQSLPEMKPNTRYRLTYYVRTENVVPLKNNGGVCVNIWDDKNLFFPAIPITGTRPWFSESFEFTSGLKTNLPPHKSYIMLWLHDATGSVWFDQLTLEEARTAGENKMQKLP